MLAPAGLCRVGHAVLGQEMADVHPGGTLVVDDQDLHVALKESASSASLVSREVSPPASCVTSASVTFE